MVTQHLVVCWICFWQTPRFGPSNHDVDFCCRWCIAQASSTRVHFYLFASHQSVNPQGLEDRFCLCQHAARFGFLISAVASARTMPDSQCPPHRDCQPNLQSHTHKYYPNRSTSFCHWCVLQTAALCTLQASDH
jgi:hypothetical protein